MLFLSIIIIIIYLSVIMIITIILGVPCQGETRMLFLSIIIIIIKIINAITICVDIKSIVNCHHLSG